MTSFVYAVRSRGLLVDADVFVTYVCVRRMWKQSDLLQVWGVNDLEKEAVEEVDVWKEQVSGET